MANTVENTVTFSGADIEVIAYRTRSTPAEKFKVDQSKRGIAKIEGELSQLRKNHKNLKDELEAKERDLIAAQARNERQSNALRSAGLGDVAAGRASENEGKFQNQQNDIKSLDRELLNLETSAINLETELSRLKDESSKNEDHSFFKLGNIHTLSYSSFREKFAVRSLGRVQAKGYTRGQRTIAGTLVFTMMQEHELFRLAKSGETIRSTSHPDVVMLDQIDPFNLLLLFANEYGAYSALHLFDIDLQSEGQEMSIDQIITHNTMNFYATEMLPMQNLGNLFGSYNEMINGIITSVQDVNPGSKLISETERSTFDAKIKNPFANDKTRISDLLSKSRGLF